MSFLRNLRKLLPGSRTREEWQPTSPLMTLAINPRKIVLRCHDKIHPYSCNPKYIAEELLRRNLPYELVWIVPQNISDDLRRTFPKGIRLVRAGTEEELREYATARLWIDNERRNALIRAGLGKKSGQVYINTWHGSSGLKAIARDRHNLKSRLRILAKLDSRRVDYLISNSREESRLYKRFFWGCGRIMEFGHPRNDIFFCAQRYEIRRRVRIQLGVPEEANLLLYAPTFRDDQQYERCPSPDFARVLPALAKKFGGKWVLGVRAHHLAKGSARLAPSALPVISCSAYPDTQELLLASDALITDYSTIILDFMHLCRPAFFFVPDLVQHTQTRGQIRPHSFYPFPFAENSDQLLTRIENFNELTYVSNLRHFIKRQHYIDDGHASERVAKLIIELTSFGIDDLPNFKKQGLFMPKFLRIF